MIQAGQIKLSPSESLRRKGKRAVSYTLRCENTCILKWWDIANIVKQVSHADVVLNKRLEATTRQNAKEREISEEDYHKIWR